MCPIIGLGYLRRQGVAVGRTCATGNVRSTKKSSCARYACAAKRDTRDVTIVGDGALSRSEVAAAASRVD